MRTKKHGIGNDGCFYVPQAKYIERFNTNDIKASVPLQQLVELRKKDWLKEDVATNSMKAVL